MGRDSKHVDADTNVASGLEAMQRNAAETGGERGGRTPRSVETHDIDDTGLGEGASPKDPMNGGYDDTKLDDTPHVKHVVVAGHADEGDPFAPGMTLVSRYRVVERLGAGGMGEVFRAHDLVLDQDVAIKVLPTEFANSETFMRRFIGEVRIARQLSHPSVCRVHDIGEIDGRPFLSMEYIDGEDLAALLHRIGRLPPEKAFELAQQLCSGLAVLHENGVLHRDLKPANLMIDRAGRLKLTDFGLAAVEAELMDHELGDGTPAYMAPEQLRGEAVTVRSDLYALGLVLYELLSGHHPSEVGASNASGHRILDRSRQPASLSNRVTGLPSEAVEMIEQCLADDPNERPSSVLDVAAVLPGGDPIAAALRGGRVPSAEAVASAGSIEGLRPWVAYLCVGMMVGVLLMVAVLDTQLHSLVRYDAHIPPAALEDRARQLIAKLGSDIRDVDRFHRLEYERAYWSNPSNARVLPGTDGPVPILFHYRQSPEPMRPLGELVSMQDPPLQIPNEVRITLDAHGHLRRYDWVSPDDHKETDSVPWPMLFERTGIDVSTLEPVEPERTPPRYADARYAWEARYPGSEETVRLEAATLGGSVVWFEVVMPWQSNALLLGLVRGLGAVFLGLLIVAGLYVPRLLKRGEVDPRGARRVAVGVMLLGCLSVLLQGHFVDGVAISMGLFSSLQQGLLMGGLAFVAYLVIEPLGRRYVPQAMISWVRLTRGRWRDASIARDVLVGLGSGALLLVVSTITSSKSTRWQSQLLGMGSIRQLLAVICSILLASVNLVLIFYLAFILLRMVMRTNLRAAAMVFVLWSMYLIAVVVAVPMPGYFVGVTGQIVGAVGVAAIYAGLTWRGGVVTTVVGLFVYHIVVVAMTPTRHLQAWYATPSLFAIALILALATYGLRFGVRYSRPANRSGVHSVGGRSTMFLRG